MIPAEVYQKIIRYAVKAPSPLNTQPWRFEVEPGVINILPDFSRSLPVSDPFNTSLYISMGSVLQNLVLASRHMGFSAISDIVKHTDYTKILIRISRSDKPGSSLLFNQIDQRQVARTKYSSGKLDDLLIGKFCVDSMQKDITIYPLLDRKDYTELIPLIERQIRSRYTKAYIKEIISWTRFSEKQAMQKGDGVLSSAYAMPFSGTFLNRVFFRGQLRSAYQTKRLKGLINQSSGLALFAADRNNPVQWIKLGSSMQHFTLKLTRAGIKYSYLPIFFEDEHIKNEFSEFFGLIGKVPLQLIRIGRGDSVPYSFRRNISHNVYMNL